MSERGFKSRSIRRLACRVLPLIAVAALCGATSGCTRARVPLTRLELPVPKILGDIPFLTPGDFRAKSWMGAFSAMHEKLRTEYALGEWKGVDWDALYTDYAGRIQSAQAKDDKEGYYLALREYAYALRDGHVWISNDEAFRENAIGGSYGFAILGLDDGRVIAHIVPEDGPAAAAGMKWGAEVVSWNGEPLEEALGKVPIHWVRKPPSTNLGRRLAQYRMLVRGPVGAKAEIAFRNPGETEPRSSTIEAVDADYAILDATYLYEEHLSDFAEPIRDEILPSGLGYIKVYFEAPTITTPFPARAFAAAVQRMVDAQAPGIILDVRGNTGGADALVPEFVGHFFTEPSFYEDVAYYNGGAKAFEVALSERLIIQPKQPHYGRPVAVLIDHTTISSGEGIPYALSRLPQVQVVGMYHTHGSFAITGGELSMPGGYTLFYTVGRSLDEHGQIQVDANAAGEGGVTPGVRVPVTEENVRALFLEGRDVILEEAIRVLGDMGAAAH